MAVIECPHCGTPVPVENDASVRSGHNASGTTEREWVMRDRGTEIHRCLDTQVSAAGGSPATNGSPPRVRVAQAQGMVSVQVPCTLDEALLLMRARALATNQTLDFVAGAVVERELRFDEHN